MKTPALALVFVLSLAPAALAAGGDPIEVPTKAKTPHASSEEIYNHGLAVSESGDFVAAESLYREAIALNPKLPEAWNGLGHSLKKQKRYDEAFAAYDEALTLRPGFALAMQYLGELYVETGQIDKARELLAQLRPIDQKNADKLAMAIHAGTSSW